MSSAPSTQMGTLHRIQNKRKLISVNGIQEKLQYCTKWPVCSGFGTSFDALLNTLFFCVFDFFGFFFFFLVFPPLFLSLAYSAKDMFMQLPSFQKNKVIGGCFQMWSKSESEIVFEPKAIKANMTIPSDLAFKQFIVISFWF